MNNVVPARWRSLGAYVLAPLLLLVALAAWALSSPIGSSPDEDFHLNSAWCGLGERAGICEAGPAGSAENVRMTPFVLSHIACYAYQPDQTGACQWLWDTQLTKTTRLNSTNNYPPVFYAVMGVFATPTHIVGSVLAMRFFNLLLFVALGVSLFALLPRPRRYPLVMSWAVTVVPLGMFLIASANPSSWTIVGCGTAWLAALGFFETHGRQRAGLAVLALIGGVMAAGSRSDGGVFCALGVVLAFVLSYRRGAGTWHIRRLWLPLVVGAMSLATFVFSTQSLNLLTGVRSSPRATATGAATATPTPTAVATHAATATATPLPAATGAATAPDAATTAVGAAAQHPHGISLLFHNLLDLPWLWTGALGGAPLGWLDTEMPIIVGTIGLFAFGALVFLGLRVMDRRKAIALIVLLAALVLIPLYTLQVSDRPVGVDLQPRYLLPLLILFAGIAVLPAAGRAVWLNTTQRIVLIVAISVSNSAALYANLARYVHVPPNEGFDLNHGLAWWWTAGPVPSPMVLWLIGSIAFAAALAIVVTRTHAEPVAEPADADAAAPVVS